MTDSDAGHGSLQEILDRCFGVDPRMRTRLAKGRAPTKLLGNLSWVTGLPRFRWQSVLGLLGIAAGPQILWWQNGDPTLLTWLSPLPALGTLGWWAWRHRAYRVLSRRLLGGPMVSTRDAVARTTTRWSTDSEGTPTAHHTLHVQGETFPLPAGMGDRTVEGRVRIHILSLVSLSHPEAPPTRWLAAVELLDPT